MVSPLGYLNGSSGITYQTPFRFPPNLPRVFLMAVQSKFCSSSFPSSKPLFFDSCLIHQQTWSLLPLTGVLNHTSSPGSSLLKLSPWQTDAALPPRPEHGHHFSLSTPSTVQSPLSSCLSPLLNVLKPIQLFKCFLNKQRAFHKKPVSVSGGTTEI